MLLAKGLNKGKSFLSDCLLETPHDIVEKYSYQTVIQLYPYQTDCMLNDCTHFCMIFEEKYFYF